MNELHRNSRSRSKAAPETSAPAVVDNTGNSTPVHVPAKAPRPEPLESPEPASISLPPNNSTAPHAATEITTPHSQTAISAGANGTNEHNVTRTRAIADAGDDGSSSLSDPDDSVEDRDETAPVVGENDCKAETVCVADTPRQPSPSSANTLAGQSPNGPANIVPAETSNRSHSPSARAHQQSTITGPAPSRDDDDDKEIARGARHDPRAGVDNAATASNSDGKRRRSSSTLTSVADDVDSDVPARKRPRPAQSVALNGDTACAGAQVEEQSATEKENHAPEGGGPAKPPGGDEMIGKGAGRAVNDTLVGSKNLKGRKGQRKGKKGKSSDSDDHVSAPRAGEDEEAPGVGGQSANSAAMEEERGRKDNARDELVRLEQNFRAFLKRRIDEQLYKLDIEHHQLQQPVPSHPEYLAMLQPVSQRCDEKIRQEHVRFNLRKGTFANEFVATHATIHHQAMKKIGEGRSKVITECNVCMTQLQRERRYFGTSNCDYSTKFPPRRSQQVEQQTAYNMEVSILSGIAKHVGFPAAPDLTAARPLESDRDLAAMGIPVHSDRSTARPQVLAASSHADRAAVEEPLSEQSAWAHPPRPAQGHGQRSVADPPQRAMGSALDPQALGSSAPRQVIDIQFNPPSSRTAGQHARQTCQRDAPRSPVFPSKPTVIDRNQRNYPPADAAATSPGFRPSREAIQADSYRVRDLCENSSLLSHLGLSGMRSSVAKDDDAGERFQRAAMRTGVVGGAGHLR